MKIGLITSRGGHLFQLYQLKGWWSRYERFWVTGRGEDTKFFLKKERVYYAYFPESRNFLNAIKNLFLGFKILKKEKPDLLVSCGAGIAPPIFLAGKLLGCKLVFMEPYDFIAYPSLSGRLIAPIADKILVQHKRQKRFYKKSQYWGGTI
ncbi:UDP-N-acetylglucosamine--LPS N-acetylglucosamine transferase [Candidatus Shapirobacteria bacterium CG10_big_fil_rev_8_21_14_0_10_40_9]|uniref:UDP-N-acetylglucosamine--LPS N-acetylglucosamine transferase n=1 Tax=Candidatus Shapirobacteria bacterium CG10_big_fil_rev_8_21_14_0_10_40_9 TaxID=1974888 RepID=A0A2M8L4D1_9BACT|nr:MAG: UDP-N-acetylglucosamine--LPS N-acetylglucosamine transferase [Candidatus Shapirobacteria bacterium CG10_big_fil_rev_8_21_14_0_10_40_9]